MCCLHQDLSYTHLESDRDRLRHLNSAWWLRSRGCGNVADPPRLDLPGLRAGVQHEFAQTADACILFPRGPLLLRHSLRPCPAASLDVLPLPNSSLSSCALSLPPLLVTWQCRLPW